MICAAKASLRSGGSLTTWAFRDAAPAKRMISEYRIFLMGDIVICHGHVMPVL